jgi:DNA modification methylase
MVVATDRYTEFLESKRVSAAAVGFNVDGEWMNPALFPFQRDIVRWALRKGRAALFCGTGLGKTVMQLEWARLVHEHTGSDVLILAPLAVAQQTVREGEKFGIAVTHAHEQADVRPGITVTNYERLHRFDPAHFGAVVLDESSRIKDYTSATRIQILEAFEQTPYRLACTATPAPNDYMELGNHAEFLGVMSRVEMLSMFFVHDGGATQDWRLKGHAESEFWRWLCSWAVMLRKPSDLGYADGDFALPPLEMHQHTVESAHAPDGMLFAVEALSLIERRQARKASLDERVKLCAAIVNAEPVEPWIVWCDLNAEGDALCAALPGAVQITGSDSEAVKESRMLDFSEGRIRILVTKPSIAGHGLNWQHTARVAFVGLSDSWEQYFQAIRRCWRFGQRRPVQCHVITSTAEGAVVANIERKERDAARLAEEMVNHMQDLNRAALQATERELDDYQPTMTYGRGWTAYLGDCVETVRELEASSIDYSIFSPPFASLYTYSNSPRDMGNCRTHAEFYDHFVYLVRDLYRVLKPGRLLSFHCMNLPTSKVRDGVIGISDFRGDLIRMFQEAGFIYHSEVVIWKDPVTAMQRTKALGLLYKQLKKDSCMSRQGIPDYLVTMRKPGENPDPVTKDPDEFPVDLWQRYASPVWMDINPSDTLQKESAREERDEKHIAPLQLEVIRRAVRLWTNPGDLVLSPFMGIGSEGYVSLNEGRQFVGVELKQSYYRQAVANLQRAEQTTGADLFSLAGMSL